MAKKKPDNEMYFIPYEHPTPPTIRPEEDDAPLPKRDNWYREGDEKFPGHD